MTDRSNQLLECVALNSWRLCVSCLLFIALILSNGCRSNRSYVFDNEREVTGAVLAEDWAKVRDVTKSVTAETPSVELRLIKGHALLALDQNNESSCLFFSITTGDSSSVAENLKKWENWTQKLADNNPNSAAAHYLKGDALARLERWDEAILTFNKALELQPNRALYLNGRGLVYAVREQWNEALVDLTKAIALNEDHAGYYASLGAYWMMKQIGARGAEAAFNKALEISPDFVFALYGRGCVRSVRRKDQEAKDDLKHAGERASCIRDFLTSTVTLALTRIEEKEGGTVAHGDSENPSMQLRVILRDVDVSGGRRGVKELIRFKTQHSNDPKLMKEMDTGVRIVTKGNPKVAENMNRELYTHGQHIEQGQAIAGDLRNSSISGLRFSNIANHWSDKLAQTKNSIQSIQRAMEPGRNPSGFKTGLEEAIWDEGNWPFEAVNGLFYVRSSNDKEVGK
jgi:tetratricopeptide (TPR) repeat protein